MCSRKHARTHLRYFEGRVPLVTRSAGASSAPESSVETPTRDAALIRAVLPCEIRIVDEDKREIEVCATSKAVDSYWTVFGYDASKNAFGRWAGNVREMHDRKAVGRKVAVRYDDDARRVYACLLISRGAEDSWEKVIDGTLAGGAIGASDV